MHSKVLNCCKILNLPLAFDLLDQRVSGRVTVPHGQVGNNQQKGVFWSLMPGIVKILDGWVLSRLRHNGSFPGSKVSRRVLFCQSFKQIVRLEVCCWPMNA